MPRNTLTDARVRALKPRRTVRHVRDRTLRGFGVRVSPSGRKQFFIHCQHRGERIWKIVGDAGTMGVAEARSLADGMLVAIRRGEVAPQSSGEMLFEAVAEVTFRRHERVWKPGTLAVNSKTGPRTVPLGSRARDILDRQHRTGSPFIFPSPLDASRPRSGSITIWDRVRKEARIEDVRIHDLRHTMASHAVMNGVPVPVVSRLLGHSNVQMTLRYAHLADRDIEARGGTDWRFHGANHGGQNVSVRQTSPAHR